MPPQPSRLVLQSHRVTETISPATTRSAGLELFLYRNDTLDSNCGTGQHRGGNHDALQCAWRLPACQVAALASIEPVIVRRM